MHEWRSGQSVRVLSSKTITTSGDHSERFIPTLNEALGELGLAPNIFSKFVTTAGPGSFTGLRIAYASLKALAYENRTPIDIVNGSEARALRWVSKGDCTSFQKVHVITYITRERFVAADFTIGSNLDLSFVTESSFSDWSFLKSEESTAIILDSRTLPIHSELLKNKNVFCIDLNAEILAESLPMAKTRKTYQTTQDWIGLTPNYFGSTRY